MALKQAAVDDVGRDTITGLPSSCAEIEPPTGMSASLAICCPDFDLAAGGRAPAPPQAASGTAPAPARPEARPAASTVRRATGGVWSGVVVMVAGTGCRA